MKRKIFILIFISSISAGTVFGQISPIETSQLLEKLFGRLVNNYDDSERIKINDSITLIIDSYAASDTVFNHRFNNLKYLGQITSPDSLLKIITWNLVLGSSPGRYLCYFIRKQEPGMKNRITRLKSFYKDEPLITDTVYTGSNWYGALYYDIKPFISENKQSWILLGIDYGNPSVSRKIIDVLSFDSRDSVIFGRKFFDPGERIRFRAVFEYASNGMMSLRFSSDSLIVFDHLVPFSPAFKDDRQYYGPDYSLDAYSLVKGIWKLKINVDARNKE
jgi:hypothetical protein